MKFSVRYMGTAQENASRLSLKNFKPSSTPVYNDLSNSFGSSQLERKNFEG